VVEVIQFRLSRWLTRSEGDDVVSFEQSCATPAVTWEFGGRGALDRVQRAAGKFRGLLGIQKLGRLSPRSVVGKRNAEATQVIGGPVKSDPVPEIPAGWTAAARGGPQSTCHLRPELGDIHPHIARGLGG
jgi:hypothetical protein